MALPLEIENWRRIRDIEECNRVVRINQRNQTVNRIGQPVNSSDQIVFIYLSLKNTSSNRFFDHALKRMNAGGKNLVRATKSGKQFPDRTTTQSFNQAKTKPELGIPINRHSMQRPHSKQLDQVNALQLTKRKPKKEASIKASVLSVRVL